MYEINEDVKRAGGQNNKELQNKLVLEALKDSIIITHYNRKTYRIDSIDFSVSPSDTFIRDGQQLEQEPEVTPLEDTVLGAAALLESLSVSAESVRGGSSSDDASSTRGKAGSDSGESLVSSEVETGDESSTLVSPSGSVVSLAQSFRSEDCRGKVGEPVEVVLNYFKMKKTKDFKLYGYRVDFDPPEDLTRLKRSLMNQHAERLGNFMFDGHTLYSGHLFPDLTLTSNHPLPTNNTEYRIRVRKVSDIAPRDKLYLQFYNIALRSVMEKMGLEQIGRHFYDRREGRAIPMPQEKLDLWPGFITAVREHDEGILLCVEVTHKVLRRETAYDIMYEINEDLKRAGKQNNKELQNKLVLEALKDSIIITHYNRKTYRIDSIDFSVSPTDTFIRDGQQVSYAAYFKEKWGIPITYMNQPMLVSNPRKKDLNKGVEDPIYLVPELCHMTGLTDKMRKNFELMKKLSKHLHMDPEVRRKKLEDFNRELKTDQSKEEFAKWHFEFSNELVRGSARVMERQSVELTDQATGQKQWYIPDRSCDWTVHFRNAGVSQPVEVPKWIIFVPSSESEVDVKGLVRMMKEEGKRLGVTLMPELAIVKYDGRNKFDLNDFMRGVAKYKGELDLIFYILPNNALPRYAAVKRACTLEMKTVSQCFQSKHLRTSKNLRSICQKMLIQVNAKLMGEPWAVKIPLGKIMILGFDVYHCPDRKGESVGALVATVNKNCTKYFSTVSFHRDKSELSTYLCTDVLKSLIAYKETNRHLPTRILLFRDGVGEGQIEYVRTHEVEQVKLAIRRFYKENSCEDPVRLGFVIVTKKINTRFVVPDRARWTSPIPGTVLDNTVTLPERYEFFLVSQTVRQGTVSPTNYHVVHDDCGLSADQLQIMAYKLCHLYFNWSGTVAVPAPCQYAHKLAYITGMALADECPPDLKYNLWYL